MNVCYPQEVTELRQEPRYGMVSALAEVIGCTKKFARCVVAAVVVGTEANPLPEVPLKNYCNS